MDNPAAPIPPAAPQPAVSLPAESTSRRWILWLTGGVALLTFGIAIGVFGVKFLNQSQGPSPLTSIPSPTLSPIPTPTPDPTENWKTYTNTKYGFSIRHLEELSESVTNIDSGSFGEKVFFNVRTVDPQNCRGDCPIIEKTEKVSVANLETAKIEGWQGEIGGCGPQKYLTYVFKKDQYFISFTLFAATCEELKNNSGEIAQLKEVDINLFNQILSTFHFLK